ncbi:BTB/POZ and MATH domain-containing protein 2-like [Aegilops tauschii subsp. strangulata]|uniref:BTB/POZ and MATH domain-containing protein 2-like n=1 Tax=Aegilops tauschii subsp. strangulata TaxID=200361 RepID=UPI003CC863EE
MDSAVLQFRLDYEQVKRLSVDDVVCSEAVSVGQHLWRIDCYPRGPEKYSDKDNGNYVSLYLRHMSSSRSVHAIFDAFLMDGNGDPSEARKTTRLHKFEIKGDPLRRDDWGCHRFVARTVLEENYVIDGHITFVCTVIVMRDTPVTVPPSDIGNQLGCLLDQPHGTDVSFTVDGETFPANRAILAARSPVFKAELFGSMAEAAMSSITLHDITPATFKHMLRFIYTDEFPTTTQDNPSNDVLFDLLASADRYALDRLKLMCVQKLWDNVSMDTVTDIQACAEMYNCPELKDKCVDFIARKKGSKKQLEESSSG